MWCLCVFTLTHCKVYRVTFCLTRRLQLRIPSFVEVFQLLASRDALFDYETTVGYTVCITCLQPDSANRIPGICVIVLQGALVHDGF
jgi:hypothetical protein